MADWAKSNNVMFRGHVLFWPSPDKAGSYHHIPKVFAEETDYVKLEKFMEDFTKRAINTIGFAAQDWDVVNEVIMDGTDTSQIYKDTNWLKINDFICKAFKASRKTDSSMKLYYNDYNHASATKQKVKSDKVYNMINEKKACGIDGVGF